MLGTYRIRRGRAQPPIEFFVSKKRLVSGRRTCGSARAEASLNSFVQPVLSSDITA
jgi:hypothetical protein